LNTEPKTQRLEHKHHKLARHNDYKSGDIEVEVDVVTQKFLLEINEPEGEAENDNETGHHAKIC
jgi:hypothetical protein